MKKISFILLLGMIFTVGCNDDFLDLKPLNNYTEDTYFTNADQCLQAVNATYAGLYYRGLFARDYYFLFDMLSNDAAPAPALTTGLPDIANYSYSPGDEYVAYLWRSLYRIIARANLTVNKVTAWEPEQDADIALKPRIIAEAQFLRGFAYFNLATLWGRVPLRKDWASKDVYNLERSPVADVWAFVEEDFSAAASVLPEVYADSDLGRVTKGAAVAMLGKAYLYQEKWAQAATELAKLDGMYTLDGVEYDDNFRADTEFNDESIFEINLNYFDGTNTWYMFGGHESWGPGAAHSGRGMEYGFNDWQNVYVSDATVAAFTYKDEADADYIDPRGALVFYGDPLLGGDPQFCDECPEGIIDFPYSEETVDTAYFDAGTYRQNPEWRKYQNYEWQFEEGLPESSINTRYFRYADALLMRAEALIMDNKVSDALPLINKVRARVGAFEYTSLGSQTEAMDKIMLERRIELCGEQSRFFDLVRWGIAKEVINAEKTAEGKGTPFQDKHYLLPIPTSEKEVNQTLAVDVASDWN